MKISLCIFLAVILASIVACDKDKFETKPRIEVKDYSSQVVPSGGSLTVRLNYFDKEGDLGTGQIYIYRERLNRRLPNLDRADTFRYQLPEFSNQTTGEIRLDFLADELKESSVENDTLRFKVSVMDLGNHSSDTITTANLVILK